MRGLWRGLALLVAVLVLVPAVRAQDDEQWEEDERRLEVQLQENRFELRSDNIAGALHDRIRLELDGPNVRFKFDLQEEPLSGEVQGDLDVRLERIVEFRDENGDGRFNTGDAVRAEYDQGDLLAAGNIGIQTVSEDGVPGLEVTANYSYVEYPDATFTFRATAFGNVTTFQGVRQRPVEIKLDMIFENFPFTDGDTLVGTELKVRSESPQGPNITATSVGFTTGNLTAVFAWKSVSEVDGVEQPVGVTAIRLPDEIENGEVEAVLSLTFAYARGARIVHDPTFGFLRTAYAGGLPILGDVGLYAFGALAAAALFGVVAFGFRRRKVKRE